MVEDSITFSDSDEVLPEEFSFLEDDPDFNGFALDDNHWNNLALESMSRFFSNQKTHLNEDIDEELLYSPNYISIVRDLVRTKPDGFEKTVSVIYKLLHAYSPLRRQKIDLHHPWDIEALLDIFKIVHTYSVPKEFVPGLSLLYLVFCKGYNLDQELMVELLQ